MPKMHKVKTRPTTRTQTNHTYQTNHTVTMM